ncbi:MAG: hypothetical protein WB630_15095 [Candidatus Acidiferrales bacterium]
MSGADQVHGNVRIDKNHKSAPLPYPLSISANILIHVAGEVVMLHGRTDNVELLAEVAYRLTPAG